jgi:putative flippase GtrA
MIAMNNVDFLAFKSNFLLFVGIGAMNTTVNLGTLYMELQLHIIVDGSKRLTNMHQTIYTSLLSCTSIQIHELS